MCHSIHTCHLPDFHATLLHAHSNASKWNVANGILSFGGRSFVSFDHCNLIIFFLTNLLHLFSYTLSTFYPIKYLGILKEPKAAVISRPLVNTNRLGQIWQREWVSGRKSAQFLRILWQYYRCFWIRSIFTPRYTNRARNQPTNGNL